MHDIRQKKWGEVIDEAERTVLRYMPTRSPVLGWSFLTLVALRTVQKAGGRKRKDYFTREDRAAVEKAWRRG